MPVVANGGIKCLDDAKRCLIETKAQAVMAGSLYTPFNPQASMFHRSTRNTAVATNNSGAHGKPSTV